MQSMLATVPDERWPEMQKAGVANLVTDPARAKTLGEMCASVPRATTVRYILETMSSDLRAEVPKISMPLLTIAAISLESGAEPARRIENAVRAEFKAAPPNVRLVFIEGSRHFVMDDRPAEMDRLVEDFLAGRELHDVPATTPATLPAMRRASTLEKK
jgi:pimeloyl-ACP methyl ester carboxylesterase